MRRLYMWLLIMLLSLPTLSSAAWIQYSLADGRVTAALDAAIPDVDGYGVITLAEDVSAIMWPVPSGCTVGQPEWTRITSAIDVTAAGAGMALLPNMLWFSSSSTLLPECAVVGSAAELWALVNTTIATSYTTNTLIPFLPTLNIRTHSICPTTNGAQVCIDVRTAMETLNNDPLNAADLLKDFLEAAVQLQADATSFAAANFP